MADKIRATITVDGFIEASSSNRALQNRRDFITELASHQPKPVNIRFQKSHMVMSMSGSNPQYYRAIIEYELDEPSAFDAQVKLNEVIQEKIEPFLDRWNLVLEDFHTKEDSD